MKTGYEINDRYQIIRPLGEGGMANVYLAHDLILDRDVSVKLLRLDLRDDPATKRRFQREALAATQLNDPHIVRVYDVGTDQGLQYMVMEYVKGTDLKDYLKAHGPLPLPQVIDIMEQVLAAVQAAHAHGIIHRDLKPQNILIDDHQHIKITDFGIATASTNNALTQTNTLLGSVHYLSPEQARGGMATEQSDIYALGIILYELLTGRVPFEGESAVAIALKHFKEPVPSVRALNPAVPQPLENVIERATAKEPRYRYQSVGAMAQDLATTLDPGRAKEPPFTCPSDVDEATRVLDPHQLHPKEAAAPDREKAASRGAKKTPRPVALRHRLRRIGGGLIAVLTPLVIAGGWYFNRSLVVPDLTGQTTAQAERTLKAHHLAVGQVQRQNSPTVASDVVIKTASPARVRYGREVNLVVSNGVSHYTMADYVGNDYGDVAENLRAKGFTVRSQREYSSSVDEGQIIRQSAPNGATLVPGHDVVTLTVSAGPRRYKLPDFKGQDVAQVQDYASKHGLQLTVTQEATSKVAPNHVISQAPKAGRKLEKGDTLAVKVADSGSQLKTTTIQINIPFDGNGGKKENRVQVYIADAYHNLTMEYQDITINQETTINVPFTLKNNQMGAYRVIRNGRTIMSATNITG